jgi:hypothetical protein
LLVPIDILFFKQRHVIYMCYVICMISDKGKEVVGKRGGGEKNWWLEKLVGGTVGKQNFGSENVGREYTDGEKSWW